MARLLTTNLAASTLQSSLGSNTTDTSVSLATGGGALFPALPYSGDFFSAAIIDISGNVEFVKAVARSGDSLTVVRAQEGTSARAFAVGSRFELRLTAADIGFMQGSYWSREPLVPVRVDGTSFTLSGDVTGTYVPNRAVRAIQTSSAQGYVVSATYDSGANLTTIVVRLLTIDTGIAAVEYGQDPSSAPFYGTFAETLANLVAADAGGTANALTVSYPDAPSTSLADRMRIHVRASAANTGAATLVVTLGATTSSAYPIKKLAFASLEANDVAGAGYVLDLEWNSVQSAWLLLNPAIIPGNAADQFLRMDSAGKIPAGTDGSQLINLPNSGISANLPMHNALKLGILAGDSSGAIPNGWLYLFATDELVTKTSARYDSSGKYYTNSVSAIAGATGTTQATGGLQNTANIFDDNDSTFSTTIGAVTSFTAGKDYGAGAGKNISKATVYVACYAGFVNGANPQVTITLYGSNTSYGDAGATSLGSTTFTDADGTYTVTSSNTTTAYRYVWVDVSQNGAATGMGLNSVTFYSAPSNMALVPSAITAGASPKSIDLYLLHKAVDTVTLDTDLKIRVTLDGTNWSAYGTLEDLGQYDVNDKFLHAKIDTSALTGTTGIKWEITTYNSKSQQVRAVGMQLTA